MQVLLTVSYLLTQLLTEMGNLSKGREQREYILYRGQENAGAELHMDNSVFKHTSHLSQSTLGGKEIESALFGGILSAWKRNRRTENSFSNSYTHCCEETQIQLPSPNLPYLLRFWKWLSRILCFFQSGLMIIKCL